MMLVIIAGGKGNGRGSSYRRKELSENLVGDLVEIKVRQSEKFVSQNEELSFREKLQDKIYMKTDYKVVSEFSDRLTINVDWYANLRVFDIDAIDFLNVSLVAKCA